MQRGSAARSCERGQAMVELVLISPVIFLLVGGIIQMALALNYWLDMQRIANQGARWAVVAQYPLADGSMCIAGGPCRDPITLPGRCSGTAAQSDRAQPRRYASRSR